VLRAYLAQIRTPDAETERKRRLARRCQVVRHRTRLKNEVHSILHAHLIPKCPHADPLTPAAGRGWPLKLCRTMSEQPSIGTSVSLTG
jgi:transposase